MSKEDWKEVNIHDYLERIKASPPPVLEADLANAMGNMIVVGSVEEAAEIIIRLDEEEAR